MKCLLALCAPALALLLFASTSARAEPVPAPGAKWGYNFSPLDGNGQPLSTVSADQTDPNVPPGGITFTNESPKPVVGNSDVVATSLQVFSAADGLTPEYLNTSGAYTLQMIIYDLNAPGAKDILANDPNSLPHTDSIIFSGKVGGNFSHDNANVTNDFIGATYHGQFFAADPVTDAITLTVSLGDYNYTVKLNQYTHPGPQVSNLLGSLGGHVDVFTLSTGGISTAPEPSSMLLCCLGLPFLGAASWRKRRAALRVAA